MWRASAQARQVVDMEAIVPPISSRVLRRPMQAGERVRLGLAHDAAVPAAKSAPAAPAPAPSDSAVRQVQQVVQERLLRMEELEKRLAGVEGERELLRVQLSDLQEQIAARKAAAHQEGYADGLKNAEAQAKRELAAVLSSWQTSLEHGQRQYESSIQAIQSQLTEVVMTAVTKLLGDHAMAPALVKAAVEQTLREAGGGVPARVLIAPSQYEQLTRLGAPNLAALRERRIEIAPDARVAAGGCMIETSNGLIDGRFEVQLQRLREIVSRHLAPAASGGAAR